MTLLSLLPHSRLDAVSSLYETEPVDDGAAPGPEWFLNGVAQIETNIAPKSLLEICREIERALGRDQENRKGPRTLDLDLLLYDDCVSHEPRLTFPIRDCISVDSSSLRWSNSIRTGNIRSLAQSLRDLLGEVTDHRSCDCSILSRIPDTDRGLPAVHLQRRGPAYENHPHTEGHGRLESPAPPRRGHDRVRPDDGGVT